MSKIKSPPEKKAASYKKDHVVLAEYPKGFRNGWPRKKAEANRRLRHKVDQLLLGISNLDSAIESEIANVRRETVKKWDGSSIPLAAHVSERLKHREETVNARKKRRTRDRVGDGV